MVVLLVLFMIISFLTIDYFVQRSAQRGVIVATPRSRARRASPRAGWRRRGQRPPRVDDLPGGVFVSPWHVWVHVEPTGSVKIGVDRLLLSFLGNVDCLYALPQGTEIRRGGPLLMLRSAHRALKIRSPVDGVVTAVNDRMRRDPERIAQDPFERGWIYRISPIRLSDALAGMTVAEDARGWMQRELGRLRDLLVASVPASAAGLPAQADGGLPVDELPELVGNREWEALVEKFFRRVGSNHETRDPDRPDEVHRMPGLRPGL